MKLFFTLKQLILAVFVFSSLNFSAQKLGKEVPITGNVEQLRYFFESLSNTKDKKIRVAHYGDSIILGDVITEHIREILQDKFGGKGIGFIDCFSKANMMRKSIAHQYSSDWDGKNILQNKDKNDLLGISGQVSICGETGEVSISNTKHLRSSEHFNEIYLFYRGKGKVDLTINNNEKKSFELKNKVPLDKLKVEYPQIRKLEIKFTGFDGKYVYGMSLEGGNGIYVDNFPITGDSGVSLLHLDQKVINEFKKDFDYKLIILNYGVNVSTPNRNVFKIYEKKMLQVIKYLKKLYPKTSILLVSAGDKTVRKGGRFVTDKNIPKLLKTQEKIAKKSNIAFWNMAQAMGGKNSMNKWVSNSPPWALKDYLHFTHEGGERIAELMMKALMDEYKKYKANL